MNVADSWTVDVLIVLTLTAAFLAVAWPRKRHR